MPSKKRVHLQQFGIIHLPNLDLTYIRNPKKKQNYVYAHPPLGNLHQESFSILPSWFAKLLEANFSRFAKIK
jgi:hypothetical protein